MGKNKQQNNSYHVKGAITDMDALTEEEKKLYEDDLVKNIMSSILCEMPVPHMFWCPQCDCTFSFTNYSSAPFKYAQCPECKRLVSIEDRINKLILQKEKSKPDQND